MPAHPQEAQSSPALLCAVHVGASVRRRAQKAWSRADLADLEATWPKGDIPALCKRLDRNYKTVARRASLLGLRRDPEVLAETRIACNAANKAREDDFGERKVLRTTCERRTMVDRALSKRTDLEVAWGGCA